MSRPCTWTSEALADDLVFRTRTVILLTLAGHPRSVSELSIPGKRMGHSETWAHWFPGCYVLWLPQTIPKCVKTFETVHSNLPGPFFTCKHVSFPIINPGIEGSHGNYHSALSRSCPNPTRYRPPTRGVSPCRQSRRGGLSSPRRHFPPKPVVYSSHAQLHPKPHAYVQHRSTCSRGGGASAPDCRRACTTRVQHVW